MVGQSMTKENACKLHYLCSQPKWEYCTHGVPDGTGRCSHEVFRGLLRECINPQAIMDLHDPKTKTETTTTHDNAEQICNCKEE